MVVGGTGWIPRNHSRARTYIAPPDRRPQPELFTQMGGAERPAIGGAT